MTWQGYCLCGKKLPPDLFPSVFEQLKKLVQPASNKIFAKKYLSEQQNDSFVKFECRKNWGTLLCIFRTQFAVLLGVPKFRHQI